jgi:hypothetical protein
MLLITGKNPAGKWFATSIDFRLQHDATRGYSSVRTEAIKVEEMGRRLQILQAQLVRAL